MDTTGGYQSLLGLTSINSNSSTIDVLDVENININGVIDLSQAIVGGLTTSQVDEGLNLYYTDTRVNNNSNVSSNTTHRDRTDNPHAVTATQVGINSTDDIIEGVTNLYYTDIRFDGRLATKTTSSLTEGTNLYYTDARFDTRFGIKTTTDLTEGTNLYYTDARFDTRFGNKTTTDLTEGTNLYYTTARANADFDTRLATKTTTNLTEGTNLYYTDARFDTRFAIKTTDNLAEGSNLYYTDARFDTRFGIKTTTNLVEGTNLYYTDARFDTRLATKSTTNLVEGTNLYYTDARVSANTNVSANTAKVSADGSINTHSDVSILEVQDQQFLKYSSFTQKWANVTPTTAMIAEHDNLYYTDARFDTRFATKTTTNLTEGTNLYYTEARFDTSFGVKKTTDLTEGINLYYTDARFDTRFGIKTTTNLTEGTNLYYTEARVSANTDVKANSDYRAVGHLPLSGGGITGNLNMGNYKITSLATPTADTDGANKKYIDDKFEIYEEGKVLAERYSIATWANNTAEMDARFNGLTPNASQYLTNLYTMGWSGDYFGVIYNCYLYVPTDGNVTFRVRSDDSSDWFIDDALVASNYGGHAVGGGDVVTSTVFMTAGFHKSFSRVIEQSGGEGMIHDWDLNGGSTFTTIPTAHILIPKLGLSDITDIGSGAIITTSERANITTNNAKVSYPSADSTKVGFISVTQAVNLDTMESNITTNNAKVSYPSADSTKVGFISVTQAVNLDTMESDIATNNNKVSYPSADSTKVGFISVTQAVNLDTMESDIATNNNKVSYPSADSTKVGFISVTQAVNLDTMESDIATNNNKVSYPSADSTKVGFISVTQAVNLDTMESNITTNNAKISYTDSAKVGLITVTQAVNLDTMESNIATNNAKISYTDSAKVGLITVTQAVNLDTMETDITSNNAYRNVGHLPLEGGTMTGDITMGGQVPTTYNGPIMTNATTPSPYVITSSSSLAAGSQYQAFDGLNYNAWESTPNTRYDSSGILIGTPYPRPISDIKYFGEWIQVDLGANYIIPSYSIDPTNTSGGAPKSWTVGVSPDGATFTLLDRKIEQTYAVETTFTPTTPLVARYIVMSIDKVSGSAGKVIMTGLSYEYETPNYSIYNLKEPTDTHYAATKGYVDSNVQTLNTAISGKLSLTGGTVTGNLTNTGFFTANAGSKLVVQNGVNGGNSRGIFIWSSGDTNWGIYMAQSGSSRALNNGTAPAWNFSSYAIRFRVYNASDTGFIWERSDNNAIASLNCSGVFQSRGPYSNVSDRRQKENFGETFGLEFINKLKPLSFSMIYDDEKQVRHGLIAQDVEEVLAGYDLKFSGLQAVKVKIPNPGCKYEDEPTQCTMLETDEIEYTLAYSEFIAPLIKAVQELSAEVKALKAEVELLKNPII